MKIGKVAKETGLAASNIRFYEKKGLLSPARDQDSKYREYTDKDVCRLKKIMVLRRIDVPVETICRVFKQEETFDGMLQRQKEELQERADMINSALTLCSLMEKETDFEGLDVEYYLNYIGEEEKKGESFMRIHDFVEELSEYTGESVLWENAFLKPFLILPWQRTLVAALYWLLLVAACAICIWDIFVSHKTAAVPVFILFIAIQLMQLGGFLQWKREKKE